MRIGLIINPIAGIGANLGWKGTDDGKRAWDAIENGESQNVYLIAKRALNSVKNQNIEWIFGGDFRSNLNIDLTGKIVGNYSHRSNKEQTYENTRLLLQENPDIICFVGGDGTATDIIKINNDVPIIGIPAGVKIFSPCFLHRPEDLGNLLNNWDKSIEIVDIFDLDEEEYRNGNAIPKLVGSAKIPSIDIIQKGKTSWSFGDSETSLHGIADRIINDRMLENKNIIVGAGSTMKNILEYIGLSKTLLGICIIKDGVIEMEDCNRFDIVNFENNNSIDEFWLSPIGNQGHILGRGNRQIPYTITKKVGKKGIRIFATPTKIANTPFLYTDSGDSILDQDLVGYYKVITGFHDSVVRKVQY